MSEFEQCPVDESNKKCSNTKMSREETVRANL